MGGKSPAIVTFAAGWAAVDGALRLLHALGIGMLRAGGAELLLVEGSLPLVPAVREALIGLALLTIALGLLRLHTWARFVGVGLFVVLGITELAAFLGGEVTALLGVGAYGTGVLILGAGKSAFTSTKREITERSVNRVFL